MSKEMEEAAEAYGIDRTVIVPGEHHAIVPLLQKTTAEHFKSGWKAALLDSPEVRALVEALEWYGAHSTAREALAAYKKSVGE